MHEENLALKESERTLQEKLTKAKHFIKTQDKLFKEQYANNVATVPVCILYTLHVAPFRLLRCGGRQGHLKKPRPVSGLRSKSLKRILRDRR